jgi:restriction endonuclease Mrr
MEYLMKARTTLVAAALAALGSAVHAQSSQSGAPAATVSQAQTIPAAAVASAVQQAATYPVFAAGKTREHVYQELVQARQSGELERLNRTLYAHH